MADREEYVGVYSHTTNRFPSGMIIARLLDKTTVKGVLDIESNQELLEGHTYRFFGRWDNHDRYGPQFWFDSFVLDTPVSRQAVCKYLADYASGIGPAKANKLVDRFGSQVIPTLIEHPEKIVEAKILTPELAEEASRILRGMEHYRRTHIDLLDLFEGKGFPKKLVNYCIQKWGVEAPTIIKQDPYILLREEIQGCGFKRVDDLYLEQGHDYKAIQRQMYCLWYALRSDAKGHTWQPLSSMCNILRQTISNDKEVLKPTKAVELGIERETLAVWQNNISTEGWVAEHTKASNERAVSEEIRRLLSTTKLLWPSEDQLRAVCAGDKKLSEHQIATVLQATRLPVAILSGTPGCLHADTAIHDPVDGSTASVYQRWLEAKRFHVWSLGDDGEPIISLAEPPWRYRPALMFKLTFASGETFTVTGGHRVWDGTCYVAVSQICQRLQESGSIRLPSISASCLLGQSSDVPHWTRTTEDCLDRCFPGSHLCGGQPLSSLDVCRSALPPQAYALRHSPPLLRADGQACTHTSSPCILSFLRSTMGYGDRSGPRSARISQSGQTPALYVPCGGSHAFSLLSSIPIFPGDSNLLFPISVPGWLLLSSNPPCHATGRSGDDSQYDELVKVEPAGIHPYYDFHVPGFENYWACGFFHHNSGKTFTAAAVAKTLCDTLGPVNIAACAPTGKAAVRLMQKFQDYGVPIRATTIHRLLAVGPDTKGNYEFGFNRSTPLPYKVYFVDEISMCDTDLFAHFLIALPKGAHLFLIGDINQLAPVGHGAPLRDMLAAGMPHGELTEIQRNAGDIVKACIAIKDGQPFETHSTFNDDEGWNLRHIHSDDAEDTIKTLKSLLEAIRGGSKWNVIDDVQILCAVNQRSELGRKPLNDKLQNLLNPEGQKVAKNPFRVGDKIICLKNSLNIPLVRAVSRGGMRAWYTDDAGIVWVDLPAQIGKPQKTEFVANGEIGRVVAIEERITIAKFFTPERIIKIPMGKQADPNSDEESEANSGRGCNFDLGYAVSCHKSQGSEFPVVVVIADDYHGATFVCSREWWYTAVSRASKYCIILGKLATVYAHCGRVSLSERKTFLRELLEEVLQPCQNPKRKRSASRRLS